MELHFLQYGQDFSIARLQWDSPLLMLIHCKGNPEKDFLCSAEWSNLSVRPAICFDYSPLNNNDYADWPVSRQQKVKGGKTEMGIIHTSKSGSHL